ncbi:MAG TPA: polyprenyl diphosphate synthase [Coxiellaceae bacterium]|nr:polyprenyl diphosphate synthase [Coxiellaceae bacterium]
MAEISVPNHVAIIMDGNGRWANKRFMPRFAGHRAGAKVVRRAIDFCDRHHISVLTLYALSVENFQSRPMPEIKFLVSLLSEMLEKNIDELHEKNIRIRIIGDTTVFPEAMQAQIRYAQQLTERNTKMTLVLAIHYSGRWDLLQAAKQLATLAIRKHRDPSDMTEEEFAQFICLSDLPAPDLLIRTSGEQRISNFMLWQLAYTELFFTDVLWPDFNDDIFEEALAVYQKRERRFGLTSEQLTQETYVEN